MNGPLQQLFDQILKGKLPSMWATHSYPSPKPVDGYINDLVARVDFFKDWFENGLPDDFWLPGFFFTQSFLTGALQNFARKYRIPIDTLEFGFQVKERVGVKGQARPEDGVIVWGLFLDGAAWDASNGVLSDPKPKELFSGAPTVWIKPQQRTSSKPDSEQAQGGSVPQSSYSCPMYKTSERRGVLSTTGQSTNFVMNVLLPCEGDPDFWVLRGTALLTQLDD